MSTTQWKYLENCAQLFSQDCCMHLGNYISEQLAEKLRGKNPKIQ